MNKKIRNKRGITLIALVVTIVVLLILAGVSISLILDNNGIIQKSKDARKEYGQARENEQADLNNISTWIEKETENNEPEIVEPENINDWEYIEEEDGTITLNCYKGNDTEVIIPNQINGKKVKKIGHIKHTGYQPAYEGANLGSFWHSDICSNDMVYYWCIQKTITKVIITEGIEYIDDYAFYCSNALREIVLPTSLKNIGFCAFANTELNNVTIKQNVTEVRGNIFADIEDITVNVPFKEGEIPEGWDANWNRTSSNCTITVNYAK